MDAGNVAVVMTGSRLVAAYGSLIYSIAGTKLSLVQPHDAEVRVGWSLQATGWFLLGGDKFSKTWKTIFPPNNRSNADRDPQWSDVEQKHVANKRRSGL